MGSSHVLGITIRESSSRKVVGHARSTMWNVGSHSRPGPSRASAVVCCDRDGKFFKSRKKTRRAPFEFLMFNLTQMYHSRVVVDILTLELAYLKCCERARKSTKLAHVCNMMLLPQLGPMWSSGLCDESYMVACVIYGKMERQHMKERMSTEVAKIAICIVIIFRYHLPN